MGSEVANSFAGRWCQSYRSSTTDVRYHQLTLPRSQGYQLPMISEPRKKVERPRCYNLKQTNPNDQYFRRNPADSPRFRLFLRDPDRGFACLRTYHTRKWKESGKSE